MSKSIFIYEPYAAGHHVGFLRVLLSAFQDRYGWRTTLLTSEDAAAHSAIDGLIHDFADGLDVVVASPGKPAVLVKSLLGRYYAKQAENFSTLRRHFRRLDHDRRFDFALVPYMESVGIHNLALRSCFGTVPWAVIPHGLRFHFGQCGIQAPGRTVDRLQRWCFSRLVRVRSLRAVFTLDPYLASWARDPKVIYAPFARPLSPRLDAMYCRDELGLPHDRFIVLSYGALDDRKCLDLLLPAMARMGAAANITLVLAGVQDARMRGLLDGETARQLRREDRLREFDRFVSIDEEAMLFTAADAVWCYNRDSLGSSGVLVTAGQFGKAAIVSAEGLPGKIARDERCALQLDHPGPDDVARAIVELASRAELRRDIGKRAYQYFSTHNPEAFASPVASVIEMTTRPDMDDRFGQANGDPAGVLRTLGGIKRSR